MGEWHEPIMRFAYENGRSNYWRESVEFIRAVVAVSIPPIPAVRCDRTNGIGTVFMVGMLARVVEPPERIEEEILNMNLLGIGF